MSGQDGLEGSWDDRLRMIADMIPIGAKVLDLGAGAQTLRRMLPPRCIYTAADRVARTPQTLPFDMDAGVYPKGRWDVVVMAGVLEYAPHPVATLKAVAHLAPRLLLSYAHGGSLRYRTANGWRNHLSRAGLEAALATAGIDRRPVRRWGDQLVYEGRSGA